MKLVKTFLVMGMVGMIIANPLGGGAFAAETTSALVQDIKILQASLDGGTAKPADAIDQFSASIVKDQVSLDEVNALVKSQSTAAQYAAYQARITSALRGINPATLTPSETGQIAGQAIADLQTQGLYWDGCTQTWVGAALIVAAIVVGVIAIGKDKSDSQIQSDYQNQIANNNSTAQANITATNNWQTAFPAEIKTDQANIQAEYANGNSDASQIDTLQIEYNQAVSENNTALANSYQSQITTYQNDINSDNAEIQANENAISNLQAKIQEYTANPAQAGIDAQNIATQQQATDAQLQQEETSAIAAAPGQRQEALYMGIGAGIGAAVGGYLTYTSDLDFCTGF